MELWERAKAHIPGGVNSPVRAAEGAKFAATMEEFTETVRALGENRRLEDLRCKQM